MLRRHEKVIQTMTNSNQSKHGRKLPWRRGFFYFELEEDTLVNVLDYITNNECENLEILVEEEFTAEEFQITEENKYKLSSCLLQDI